MRLLKILLLWLFWSAPLSAQDTTPAPLVVPFANFPPFLYLDEEGNRTGFFVELSKEIGAEIGVPIAFLDFPNARTAINAQVAGTTQMIAGVTQIPTLAQSSAFSNVVATDVLHPIVLSSNTDLIAQGTLIGKRIGITPPATGSEEPILKGNIPIAYESPHEAIMNLLSGNIDAVLLPATTIYSLARSTQLDGRITFLGDPLRTDTRHIALHESRAALLGPINDAIARIEADGRLEAMRLKFNMTVPARPPDVLQVGVTQLPPLSVIDDNGEFSGFNVEVAQALATLAELDIAFVPLPLTDWVRGPTYSDVDIVSALVITPERQAQMDFSYPILERTAAAVFPSSNTSQPTKIADFAGQRIATIDGSIFAARANAVGTLDVVGFETNDDAVAAVLSGEIGGAILAPNVARKAIARANAENQLQLIMLTDEVIDTGLALRPGLGAIRERLNAVTPGYLLSDEYAALREQYFGEPVFWTQTRINAAVAATLAVFAALLGFVVLLRQRQQKLAYENQQTALVMEKAHSNELGKVVADLERSNRELDEFAYIASHDLKEPLRGIGINANFLLREQLPGKAGERALRMIELTGRMEQLISDLLSFSRLSQPDKGRVIVEPKRVIDAIRSDLTEWLDEHGAEIVQASEIPSLKAEQVKVKTVLQNLIINGIKFNDAAQKRVEVGFAATADVNGQVYENAIYVKDNGIGIGDAHHEKIFRIFSRLNKDADYSRGTGTGSGLAFVRKIVEEHGGAIDFNSTPGEGATFFLTLPLATEQTPKNQAA